MNAQHTPGPWSVEADMRSERIGDAYDTFNGYSDYLAGWNVTSNAGEIIGCEGIIPRGSAEANARLIAAAPDLLALAHQYRNDLLYPPAADSRERRIAAIDAALAKAGTT